MTNEQKTIRVRIAVAVSEGGHYGSDGNTTASGARTSDDVAAVWAMRDCRGDGQKAVHFIEADIPLPVSVTVSGRVSE